MKALGDAAERWLTADDPLRRQAIQALTVCTPFSSEIVGRALDNAFSELTQEKLSAFVSATKLEFRPQERPVLHILPSNVFTSWLHGATLCLLMGYDVELKPSIHEPVFAPLWRESLQRVDSEWGRRVRIVKWAPEKLHGYSAVVAYGADETLQSIRRQIPDGVSWVGYGHRFSVALVMKEAVSSARRDETLERLRLDASLFHLQGCLSPQRVYVEGKIDWIMNGLQDLPRRPEVVAIPDLKAFVDALVSGPRKLSTIGFAGEKSRLQPFQATLESVGAARLCPLGEMQKPTIAWRNGGISLPEILGRMPLRAHSSSG